ncbi:MAG: adenylate/guanylate cyclase domain-containing protein, partial [Alphaproteobacteria bacterium]
MDIGQWLTALGLEAYVQAFADHRVDAGTLPLLSMDDLKEIGVLPVGHRRKILAAAAALGMPAESETDTDPESGSTEGHGGTRRQVTVLFADIAGFTELSARLDAEQLHAVLTAYFEEVDGIIGQLGGTIDKHIGDSVMAVFGAPVAHADDVHRSVQAALRIHAAMAQVSARCGQQLEVHAGIATGEVIASLTGSRRHREYTVTGDTVNLAARLTGLARSGETVVSTGVVEALEDELLAEPMGSHAIKGLTEPVAAWRVVGMAPEHGRGTRPMFGRRAELAQCRTALESALADRRGAVIYIRGEAGIGKTRLLQAVFEAAAGLGFATHRCSVFDFGTGLEVDPLRVVGLALHGAQAEAGALPLPLKDLLGLPLSLAERGLLDAMPHAARATGRADSLTELTIASALARPVLIGIEDVHWADATTLHGIDLLARTAPARSPTVLVLTSRLEEDPLAAAQMFLGGLSLLVIELGRLHEQDARALAESLLGDANPVIDECMGRAEGNPLFLEQLVRHARSDGVGSAIPGSIRSVVLAQADRLPAIDRAAAQCAAVLGDQFSVAALRHLLQRPGYEADRLVAARLIRPDKDTLQFTHALIRDSLYSSILHAERRTLHGRAAGWFDGRDSSLHAEHLARADDPSAVSAFIAAARELDQAYRPEAAMDRIRRGATVARTPADHFALALEEGALLHELGRAAEAA